MDFFAETQNIMTGKKTIPACYNQVNIRRCKFCKCAEKFNCKGIIQQVKIIQEQISTSGKRMKMIRQVLSKKNHFFSGLSERPENLSRKGQCCQSKY